VFLSKPNYLIRKFPFIKLGNNKEYILIWENSCGSMIMLFDIINKFLSLKYTKKPT
jgi:hypothetical protein